MDGCSHIILLLSDKRCFSEFGLGSNVGRITMNGKIFLAFDDILWYIPKNRFKKYGITEVEVIE